MSEAELYRRLWMQAVGMKDDEIDLHVANDPPTDAEREKAELLAAVEITCMNQGMSQQSCRQTIAYAQQLKAEQWAAVAEKPRWSRMIPGAKVPAVKSRVSLKHSLWFLWKLGMRFVSFLVN